MIQGKSYIRDGDEYIIDDDPKGDEKIDKAAWGYEVVQKDSVGKTCHFRICAGNLTQMIRRTVGTFVKKWTVGKYCLK